MIKTGCFSGSAIELEDGRQPLMYTSPCSRRSWTTEFVATFRRAVCGCW
ncbi:MAG: hypothetical protein ACLTSZ_04945 [Lachnospiraceae bacterium]